MSDQIQKMHAIYNKLYQIQSDEIYECLIRHNVYEPLSEEDRTKFTEIVSTILGSGDSNKQKKQKKKKDPNAPKRPPASGYFIWLNSNRKNIKQQIIDEGEKPTGSAQGKKGGEIWRGMTDEEKEPWNKTAATKMKEYKMAMKKYLENKEQEGGASSKVTDIHKKSKTKKSKTKKSKKLSETKKSKTKKSKIKKSKEPSKFNLKKTKSEDSSQELEKSDVSESDLSEIDSDEEIEIDDTTYRKDSNNNLYDINTNNYIGRFNEDGTINKTLEELN